MTTITISDETTVIATAIPASTTYLVGVAGTLEVGDGGSLSGATIGNGGILGILAGGTASDTTDSGELTIAMNGVADGLTVEAGGTATVEPGGSLAGSLTTAGILDYAGGLDNIGVIDVTGSGGALIVGGSLLNNGEVEIDAGASLAVDGSYRQSTLHNSDDASLVVQVQGAASGSVAVTGAADLRGATELDILAPQTPTAGSVFSVMQFATGSLFGMFGFITGSNGNSAGDGTHQTLAGDLTAGLLYDDSTGSIALEYITTPTLTADTWTAGAVGDWSTTDAWSVAVPSFYSDAVIGADSTVALTTDATLNSLMLDVGATLSTGHGDGLSIGIGLTVYGRAVLTVDGEMTVDESTTTSEIDGTIEVAGPLLYIGTNIVGAGTIKVDAGATLELDHEITAAAVVFHRPGATFLYDNNAQLFTGVLDDLNAGGVLEVLGTVTGVTVDTVSPSVQKLVIDNATFGATTIAVGPHDDYAEARFQISVAGGLSTIEVVDSPVIAVTEAPATGTLGIGGTDALTLTLSEPETITGVPILALNDGGTAAYDAAASTSTALVFDYTVATTDTNVASLAATAIGLPPGATITNAMGNPLPDLSLRFLPQVGPEIQVPTIFIQTVAASAGALASQFLWSNPANWTDGVPLDNGSASSAVPGYDDLPALGLLSLDLPGGGAAVVTGGLQGGELTVASVAATGSDELVAGSLIPGSVTGPVTVTAGTIAGPAGTYAAFGSFATLVDQSAITIGATAGPPGAILADGGAVTIDGTLAVGAGGAGSLAIADGGSVASADAYVGADATGAAMVSVAGPGSSWVVDGTVTIGIQGGTLGDTVAIADDASVTTSSDPRVDDVLLAGTLTLATGGQLSEAALDMHNAAVLVVASGATLTETGNTTIGGFAPGTTLASGLGANGTVTFDDAVLASAGAYTAIGADTDLGGAGDATFTATDGAMAISAATVLGQDTGDTGTLAVAGTATTWTDTSGTPPDAGTAGLNVGLSGDGAVTVAAGATLSNPAAYIKLGVLGGGQGTVLVTGDGSVLSAAGLLRIGDGGAGTLTVASGGLAAAGQVQVGDFSGAVGVLEVGAGGTLTTDGASTVDVGAQDGNGSTAGVTVAAGSFTVGVQAGAQGTVSVDGGMVAVDGVLAVGGGGTGSLAVSDGGLLTSDAMIVGDMSGQGMVTVAGGTVTGPIAVVGFALDTSGTIVLTGTGTAWTDTAGTAVDGNGAGLNVGLAGDGAVTVAAGATLSNPAAYIKLGVLGGGQGTALVTGDGSVLSAAGLLRIGDGGAGTLTVANGGLAAAGQVQVGDFSGAVGVLEVGAGGTLTTDGASTVDVGAQDGNGSTTGVTVAAGSFTVGVQAGAQGTVSVDGGMVAVDGVLAVGGGGTGSLAVGDGGLLTSDAMIVGDMSGQGMVTVAGGTVTGPIAVVGFALDGSGTIVLTGTGTAWTDTAGTAVDGNGAGLNVGLAGDGAVTVAAGATLSNPAAYIKLGVLGGGQGTALVTGDGSVLSAAGLLRIGDGGAGTLTVANGGLAAAGQVQVGDFSGAVGVLEVGAGGTLATDGASTVDVGAQDGNGSTTGVTVAAGSFTVGVQAGAQGTVSVDGGVVAVDGTLSVGDAGTGSLVIGNDGMVTAGFATVGTGTTGAGSVTLDLGGTLSVLSAEVGANGSIDLAGGLLDPPGAIDIDAGGRIGGFGNLAGAITNDGFLAAQGGTLVLSGAVDGTGTIAIEAGAALALAGSIGSGQAITFDGTGANLMLDAALGFAASIVGVQAGDRITLAGIDVTGVSYDGATLTVMPAGGGQDLDFAVAEDPSAPGAFDVITQDSLGGTVDTEIACYAAGTHILTDRGEIPVEALAIGDRLVTRRPGGATAPIIWIGHRRLDFRSHPNPHARWPVCVRAGAFGACRPRRDVLLSPDHAIFAENTLIPISTLINGTTIAQQPMDAITYWHVELARHDAILAEGLPTESYLDTGNRAVFANGGTVVRLRPDFAADADGEAIWEAAACGKLRIDGAVVARMVARVRRVAGTGWQAPPARITQTAHRRATTTANLAALLDAAWYLARYPDVAASGIPASRHYRRWGRSEGRLPCPEPDLLRGLGLIDPGMIVFAMRDVVAAGQDPAEHFCRAGWQERRRPNPYFETAQYLDGSDVPAGMNPLTHYVLTGEIQGLRPGRHFDPGWYRERYAIGPSVSPLAHFLKHRRTQRFSPSPAFDLDEYLREHSATLLPDRDPYAHFLAYGRTATIPLRQTAQPHPCDTRRGCTASAEDGSSRRGVDSAGR